MEENKKEMKDNTIYCNIKSITVQNLGDGSESLYSETLSLAMKARSVLFMTGFISDVENKHINQRIREYWERYVADMEMNKAYNHEQSRD